MFPRPTDSKNLSILSLMALSYPVKRGSVSTRVDRLQTLRKEHPVELNILHEVATLERLTVGQLRQCFAEIFGEASAASNRSWLVKRIAWRLQALAKAIFPNPPPIIAVLIRPLLPPLPNAPRARNPPQCTNNRKPNRLAR